MKSKPQNPAFLRRFFVKYHDASGYFHYDLRLEYEGVLRSWALPKGLSYYPGDHCEAIEVEDHRREYGPFEGVHPSGTIMLWDRGMWEPYPECIDINACLQKGILRFILAGEKLKGGWTLTGSDCQKRNGRSVWTISKNPDSFARSEDAPSILEEAPNSVLKNRRTLKEIERDWHQGKKLPPSEPTLFEM
ncbi:MAG: DNA polymerase ligase N-terminal domain-containing protein [Terracidiphilus sp.]|jgi:bifunctional non-homologous end joining protein LigD